MCYGDNVVKYINIYSGSNIVGRVIQLYRKMQSSRINIV